MNFKWDKKYLYWGVTAFLVIAAAIVFFLGLSQIKEILGGIFSFLSILTPVLYGFVIAYILCPIATFIEKPCLRRLFILSRTESARSLSVSIRAKSRRQRRSPSAKSQG